MTNSLVGDHQVAVVDVDGGPEGGFLTGLLYNKSCLKKSSEKKDPTTLSIKFPTPRQDTL